jgi:hypothetical protein
LPNYFASEEIRSVDSAGSVRDSYIVDSDRPVSSRIDPKKRVIPSISKLNHDWMIAYRAARSPSLEYGFGALAAATDVLQNQFRSLVSSNSRSAAGFAEGSHFGRHFLLGLDR